ncbi:MAG: acetylxylan esterase [Thermoproteota archaeon]
MVDKETSIEKLSVEEIELALNRKLLPKTDPEDPQSEIHRFILTRIKRFQIPEEKELWLKTAAVIRRRFLTEIYLKGLPEDLLTSRPRIEWKGTIETGREYRIRKLCYEGFPGMWIPALLYEPVGLYERVPGVLNPNGHHSGGKAMSYKQARCINLAKRRILALSVEFIGMGELAMNGGHNRIAHLDLCGVAGVAIFYLAIKRGLDVLLSHPYCDPEKIAVTGLSGGGWQTIILSALDERVKVAVPVAGHSPIWQRLSFVEDIGDLEQVPTDFCTVADYDTLTALLAPRPLLLIYNKNDDCCFCSERTRISIYEPVKKLYQSIGFLDNIQFYENVDPGTHNYEADNRSQLYRFLNKHFGLNTSETDLPFEDELMSESQLEVGLPDDNETLLSLAKKYIPKEPRLRKLLKSGMEWNSWLFEARQTLKKVIRLPQYNIKDETVREECTVIHHRLHMDDLWTVPLTEFRGKSETQVLVSDSGRKSLAEYVKMNLTKGCTIMAADIFGIGESHYPSQYQMLINSVGERPLGIMVGQILAILKWIVNRNSSEKISLNAIGALASFSSLCAAALEPKLLSHLSLNGLYDSLKRLIQLPVEYEDAPPLFCFGLLKELDIKELLLMTENLPVTCLYHGPLKPVVV